MMKNTLLSAAAALTCLLATAAPAQAAPVAQSVSVQRTGGIGNSQASFQVSGGGSKHAAEVLRLASSPAFRALRPRYVPRNTCCDRYLYRVEVRYRNGQVKDVTALQGAPAPKVLWTVIDKVENTPVTMPFNLSWPPFPFG